MRIADVVAIAKALSVRSDRVAADFTGNLASYPVSSS
jgi:hypothetical protein